VCGAQGYPGINLNQASRPYRESPIIIVLADACLAASLRSFPLLAGRDPVRVRFVLMRFSPPDPAMAAFDGANATTNNCSHFLHENGLDDPLPLARNTAVRVALCPWQAHFGTSVLTKPPCRPALRPRCPSPCSSPC